MSFPKVQINNLLREKKKCETNFCAKITKLIGIGHQMRPNDGHLLEVKDKFGIIKRHSPDKVIKIVGSIIWQEKERIKNRDVSYFDNEHFINNIVDEHMSGEKNDVFEYITSVIRDSFYEMSEQEQRIVWNNITSMLKLYAIYIKHTKEIKKLSNKV